MSFSIERRAREVTLLTPRGLLNGYFHTTGRLSDFIMNSMAASFVELVEAGDFEATEREPMTLVNMRFIEAVIDEEEPIFDERMRSIYPRNPEPVRAETREGFILTGSIYLPQGGNVIMLAQEDSAAFRPMVDTRIERRGRILREHVDIILNLASVAWFVRLEDRRVESVDSASTEAPDSSDLAA